jgi:hypothetical protein
MKPSLAGGLLHYLSNQASLSGAARQAGARQHRAGLNAKIPFIDSVIYT